jgi:hypothetical protein
MFGNVPADVLVGTVERLVAKTDESDMAAAFERDLPSMPADAFGAFVEAIFDAFRARGESSEDAAESAGTTVERICARDPSAVTALLAYARSNAGLLREATALFVEGHPNFAEMLPGTLRTAIAQRLAQLPSQL